jgi:hypothetical protein
VKEYLRVIGILLSPIVVIEYIKSQQDQPTGESKYMAKINWSQEKWRRKILWVEDVIKLSLILVGLIVVFIVSLWSIGVIKVIP